MTGGYTDRLLFANVSDHTSSDLCFDDEVKKKFIGGYGYGSKFILENQKAGTDPFGEDNIIGILAGPLTGLKFPAVSRFTICGKSSLTNGWGDSNGSGSFGPVLKFSGFDGLFIKGKSEKPVYLVMEAGDLTYRDASKLWGKDTYQTEDMLKKTHGREVEVLCIGPSGEKEIKISAFITSKGRAAARSGLAAVMGSKKIKAIVVKGKKQLKIAEPEKYRKVKNRFLSDIRNGVGFVDIYMETGTPGTTVGGLLSGDSPVKNWSGSPEDMKDYEQFEFENMKKYKISRKGCFACPIACWGHVRSDKGPYKLEGVSHMPEYETCSSFGSYCLNNDFEAVLKCNDICNRYGIDTISAGSAVAFAMNCYEEGIIDRQDTDGLELKWGNTPAMVELTRRIASGEGFGKILSEGVAGASKIIGNGSEQFAIHINGQELPAHDPRLQPSLAVIYSLDATPGRHLQGSSFIKPPGLEQIFPDIDFDFDKKITKGRAPALKVLSSLMHCINSLGACAFGYFSTSVTNFVDCYCAVTGLKIDFDDFLKTGERIGMTRHLFNLREGLNPIKYKIPKIVLGEPPLKSGPHKGFSVKLKEMQKEYYRSMDLDIDTGKPSDKKMEELELNRLLKT